MASTNTDVGLLWLVGDDDVACELLNDNRTRHYQSLHPLWTGSICTDCQCSALDYNPCLAGGDFPALVYGDAPDDESNPAPWFDELAASSAEFLGWMVDTIDGFDYANYGRTVNQRAIEGANATPMRAAGREVTYTIIGTALTERGMMYGLNWLAAMLLGIGGRCGWGRAVIRTHCDEEDITGGLYELREVACTQAPTWTDNVLADKGCLVRGATFTLLAGDPCMYGCRSTCLTATGNLVTTPISAVCDGVTTISDLLCGPMPIAVNTGNVVACCEVAPGIAIDSRSATVQIDATERCGPFSIELYSALPETDCGTVVGDDDLYLGRVSIGALEAGQGALIDGPSRQVFFRGGQNSPWQADDSLLLFGADEYPCFPRISGCDSLYIAIRPATACPATGEFSVTIESVTISQCTTC